MNNVDIGIDFGITNSDFVISSNNNFSFEIQKGLKFENFKINSEILVHQLTMPNNLKLKRFFPKQKKTISFLIKK